MEVSIRHSTWLANAAANVKVSKGLISSMSPAASDDKPARQDSNLRASDQPAGGAHGFRASPGADRLRQRSWNRFPSRLSRGDWIDFCGNNHSIFDSREPDPGIPCESRSVHPKNSSRKSMRRIPVTLTRRSDGIERLISSRAANARRSHRQRSVGPTRSKPHPKRSPRVQSGHCARLGLSRHRKS